MSRQLWIRSEAFDHGVFNTSVRWTVQKVQDFLTALQATVSSLTITQKAWVEAATSRCKPALTEAEAAAYWHVFVVLQEAISGQKADEGLDIRTVGLLLMSQVFSPHRVRTDQFAKSGETWPGLERATAVSSPRHSPRGSSPRVGVSAQGSISRGRDASSAMLGFVRQHFGNLLQVVCLALAAEPATVSVEEFDLLGLVLCAGVSFSEPLPRLSEAIPELVSKRSLPGKDLRRTVEKLLVWNDEVYPFEQSATPQVPAAPGVPKVVNVCGMTKTTWFQRPANGDIDVLSITSCNDCTIYVTGQARFCLVAGCHDCTIIISAVSRLCSLQNCEKISIHVAAHSFKMENSIDCSAFLFCHLPPILTGDTRGIKIAPFNVLYSHLGPVLKSADMELDPEHVNVWAHPVCCTLGAPDETLGGGRSGSLEETNHSTYHFVHPDNFHPVVVPEHDVALPARRAGQPPLCLPQVYDDALKSREVEMKAFQRLFADIPDDAKKRRAQQVIQSDFRQWLQATGKSRQLADLAKMATQGLR